MIESHQLPFSLQSYQGQPSEQITIEFLNYYPTSKVLKPNVKKVDINVQEVQGAYRLKMKTLVHQFLHNDEGVINIYPKKNTIDLKKHLERKMKSINGKTDKAIIHFAKQRLRSRNPEAEIEEDSDD